MLGKFSRQTIKDFHDKNMNSKERLAWKCKEKLALEAQAPTVDFKSDVAAVTHPHFFWHGFFCLATTLLQVTVKSHATTSPLIVSLPRCAVLKADPSRSGSRR